jgi:hypothetical protein
MNRQIKEAAYEYSWNAQPRREYYVRAGIGVRMREQPLPATTATGTKSVENRTFEPPAGRLNPLAEAVFSREDSRAVLAVMDAPSTLRHTPAGIPRGDVGELLRRLQNE